MTDKDHIEELKRWANPLRVASSLGLREQGKRFFCPSCQPQGGKTADLSVSEKGFCCFKCGLKGDLIGLIMTFGHMDFPEAVAWLEAETGVKPPKKPRTAKRPPRAQNAREEGKVRHKPSMEAESSAGDTNEKTPVFEAFLERCRPVEGKTLDWLVKDKGIEPEVVVSCRLRFCGREYQEVIAGLKERYGEDRLLNSGLMKRSSKGTPVPSFWHYFSKKVGFLVIPYIQEGRPVYLKVRPPCNKTTAERLGLVRFMNTPGGIPCLYNVDVLGRDTDRVFICEGESDTWAALSAGYAAVGSPGARLFKQKWVGLFRSYSTAEKPTDFDERTGILEHEAGLSREDAEKAVLRSARQRSSVYLVPDADKAGIEGARSIAELFRKEGLPVPLCLTLPEGMDLVEYLKGADK